jgi:acyl-CoA thioester hydrolase
VTEAFRFTHLVDVRFRDLDPAGHVHHTLPLIYWEEGRTRYWREVAGRGSDGAVDYVLGGITVRYLRRIAYPSRLIVGVRVSRLGRSSLDMEYVLWDEEGEPLCTGRSTQVLYDYEAGRSVPLDEATRARIEAHEAGP